MTRKGKCELEEKDFMFLNLFVIVILIMIFVFARSMKEQMDNEKAPLSVVATKIVDKRRNTLQNNQPVAGDISGAHGYTVTTNTTCYVSFETESGDRMEFVIAAPEYNLLSEENTGKLSFKGTKFISFERESL